MRRTARRKPYTPCAAILDAIRTRSCSLELPPTGASGPLGTPRTGRWCGAAAATALAGRPVLLSAGTANVEDPRELADRVAVMEAFYPLHAKVCESCLLVQLEKFG